MARPLRIEYAGACYHVMNRGNRRQTVFAARRDCELFLERLGQFSRGFDVRILCYCCMPNHFHLYLRTEQANLSRFMQSLLTSFTVALNRRQHSSGHVFQGRFKAHLVENETYGAEVSRYIHLNPVRTKALKQAALPVRRQALRGFAWSSYAACIGLSAGPSWFEPAGVLSDWGSRRSVQMRRYREYVEEGLLRELDNPLDRLDGQMMLGTEGFIDRIRRAYVLTRSADRREQPAFDRARQSVSVDTLAGWVAAVYKCRPEKLFTLGDSDRQARCLLMYGACRYCRGAESLSSLAPRFGVSLSGLTMARDRAEQALRRDKTMSHAWSLVQKRYHAECGL